MHLPPIHGYIDRRMLLNFTADPAVVQRILPPLFRPKLYDGAAIAGICLIRLKHIKLKGLPDIAGMSSENGAHRIAVEWEENGALKEGVYIPRRDTSSRVNALAGGRLFPGQHYLAKFTVAEGDGQYNVRYDSSDGTSVSVAAHKTAALPAGSVFPDLAAASQFFERGAVGYSPRGNGRYEGVELHTSRWHMEPLEVTSISSTYFEDRSLFPEGSIRFDNALLMTGMEHEWHILQRQLCDL